MPKLKQKITCPDCEKRQWHYARGYCEACWRRGYMKRWMRAYRKRKSAQARKLQDA